MHKKLLLSCLLVLSVTAAACGSDSDDGENAGPAMLTTTAPTGDVLFDDEPNVPTAAIPTSSVPASDATPTQPAVEPGATQPPSAGSSPTAAPAGGGTQAGDFCDALGRMETIMTPQGGSMGDLFAVSDDEKAGLQSIADEAPPEIKEDVDLMVDVLLEVANAPEGTQFQAFLALQASPKGAQLAEAEKAIDEYATANCD
ncbi:MAG: hypothetical protein KA110_04305 [Acidimicrobiia bacterium]|nr:hypothetical protein [Acidimicrobiia bacterium]